MRHSEQKQQKMLSSAISLAALMHEQQFDKGGNPYILHVLHVMNDVRSSDLEIKQIAVLHDIVEDTPVTFIMLREMGFSERVVQNVLLLTKVKGMSYEDYLKGIATSRDAILVKMADIRHNTDIRRLKGLTDKDVARIAKYQKAYVFLKAELKKL